MSLRTVLISSLILLAFPCVSSAFQGYAQSFDDNAVIWWGNGEIAVSQTLGTPESEDVHLNPLAVRKAASAARKQLLDVILSVRIDAKQTVSAFLADNRELATRVRGLVQNSLLKRPMSFGEGGDVRVSEQFRGKLAELVLPTTMPFQSGIAPRLPTSLEQEFNYRQTGPEEVGIETADYTGVVIDARELDLTPALAPVIYGQDGVGAYGAFLVSRENAINRGVVAYATTMDTEQLRERVGSRPLIVRALKAYGSWRTDVIIPTSMAQMVGKVMRTGDVAEFCRVVIVLASTERKSDEQDVNGALVGNDLPVEER